MVTAGVCRTGIGVRGMKLRDDQKVVSMAVLDAGERDTEVRDQYLRAAEWKNNNNEPTLDAEKVAELAEAEEFILTLTANGYGKISSAYEYRTTGRGGQGLTNIGEPSSNPNRNGHVVASFPVRHGMQLMLVTDQAKLIRMPLQFRHLIDGGFDSHTGFSISGRGTVVTGRVEQGIIKVGEEIEIVGIRDTVKTTCTGVEMFRKLLDQGQAGDNIGALLRGVDREGVERGQVLCKPGSITPHTTFEAEAYILTKEEGGRHTPFFTNYRPQFYFRTTDVTGVVTLPADKEMVLPGDNVKMDVELIQPIAMDQGLRFAIREGGRTVGAGVVSAIKK